MRRLLQPWTALRYTSRFCYCMQLQRLAVRTLGRRALMHVIRPCSTGYSTYLTRSVDEESERQEDRPWPKGLLR